jgi:DNA invertase Pin-like site-specific DNA recombinase
MDDLEARLTLIAECVARRRIIRFLEPPPAATRHHEDFATLSYAQETAIAARMKNGESETKLAREFHVSRPVVHRVRERFNIPGHVRITPEVKAQISDALRSRQGTWKEIAARFHVCRETVRKIKREVNI